MNTSIDKTIPDGEDPEFALIADYLAGDLTPQNAEAFATRLLQDPAFMAKAEPLLTVFASGIDFRGALARAEARALQRTAEAPVNAAAEGPVPESAPVSIATTVRVLGSRLARLRPFGMRILPGRRSLRQMAAAAVILMMLAGVAKRDVLIGGFPFSPFALGYSSDDPVVRMAFATRRGETQRVGLRDSSFAELRTRSRINWYGTGRFDRVRMNGEVAFVLSRTARSVMVASPHGTILLRPGGSYAVRADAATRQMYVTVERGTAWLLGGAPTDVRRVTEADRFGLMRAQLTRDWTEAEGYPQPFKP